VRNDFSGRGCQHFLRQENGPNRLVQIPVGVGHSHEASEPRDKIFALTPIFAQLGIQLPKENYRESISVVYREATWAIIQQTASVSILERINPSQRSAELPSWVHDFREPAVKYSTNITDIWHASRDSHVDATLSIETDLSQLGLAGINFSRIAQ
jgi:hypothetical protein